MRNPQTLPGWWLGPVPLSISSRSGKINASAWFQGGGCTAWLAAGRTAGFPLSREPFPQRMAAPFRSLSARSPVYEVRGITEHWVVIFQESPSPRRPLPQHLPPTKCLFSLSPKPSSILFLSQFSTFKSPAQRAPGAFRLQTCKRKGSIAEP